MATAVESNGNANPVEAKYSAEIAKRMRADGMKQFEPLQFSEDDRIRSLAEDIFADHEALDKLPVPISDGGRVKFLVLGAGLGGIIMAVKLIKKGFSQDQILLIDSAGGVGGTWYWNRYPGVHCDVESYIYLPLLEETGYMPRQKYSPGVEIRKYLESVVEKFGLKDRVLFRTQARSLTWDEERKAWKADLTTHRGAGGKEERDICISADFVTLANGLFPYPQVPKGLGLSSFEGPMMHTSRWRYEITGGSSAVAFPEMEKLRGKKVGIIGTGATAIQVVPQLAKYAEELFVFQRTPSQVNSRGQRDTDPTEWREKIAAKQGWQQDRMENFSEHLCGNAEPGVIDLVGDGWTQIKAWIASIGSKRFGLITPDRAQEHVGNLMKLDSEHTTQARERIKQIIKDPDTATKLTPWYPSWCKRPTFSDEYLEAFNQTNVHLVDTDGQGVEKFTPKGILANSQEYAFDILILSTGFRSPYAGGDPGSRMGITITGRDGRRMAEKWEQQGTSTLHGVCTAGFPNLFFQGPVQASVSANYNHLLNVQSEHIADMIAIACERAGGETVAMEVSVAAEDAWGMQIARGAAFFRGTAVCGPSYMNMQGESLKMPDPKDPGALLKKAKGSIWCKGLCDYAEVIGEWRREGKLEGVEIRAGA